MEYVPLLELDLRVIGTGLSGNETLEVADSVVRTALYAHYLGYPEWVEGSLWR